MLCDKDFFSGTLIKIHFQRNNTLIFLIRGTIYRMFISTKGMVIQLKVLNKDYGGILHRECKLK